MQSPGRGPRSGQSRGERSGQPRSQRGHVGALDSIDAATTWFVAALDDGRNQSRSAAEMDKWEKGKQLFLEKFRGFVDRNEPKGFSLAETVNNWGYSR